jgi:FSR family fosmidomycin resistance protein-like MFS transporter
MNVPDMPGTGEPLAAATHWKAVGLITAGHALVDLCQGMVPALLPFLVSELDLSYAAGAGLVFANSAASSIVQPFFGYLADRASFRWLLPVSVLVTGGGLALGSQSPNYAVFFSALMVSSLGIAAFHPQAARQIHRLAGAGRATEMSVFSVGGNVGFALAPLITIALLVGLGRMGTLLMLLPTGVLALLLAGQFLPPERSELAHSSRRVAPATADSNWFGFLLLCGVTVCRSIIFAGFNTFLALYWMSRWEVSPDAAATVLAIFLGTGICGTLLGGWLADRFGRRTVLTAGFATAGLLLPLLLATDDRAGATLVLAISVGGMVAPALGLLADRHGVAAVLLILETLLVTAVVLGCTLPEAPSRSPQLVKQD